MCSNLQDYHFYSVDSSTAHPISEVLSYDALSNPYLIFINAINKISEPQSYVQAKKLKEWCDAMGVELNVIGYEEWN